MAAFFWSRGYSTAQTASALEFVQGPPDAFYTGSTYQNLWSDCVYKSSGIQGRRISAFEKEQNLIALFYFFILFYSCPCTGAGILNLIFFYFLFFLSLHWDRFLHMDLTG